MEIMMRKEVVEFLCRVAGDPDQEWMGYIHLQALTKVKVPGIYAITTDRHRAHCVWVDGLTKLPKDGKPVGCRTTMAGAALKADKKAVVVELPFRKLPDKLNVAQINNVLPVINEMTSHVDHDAALLRAFGLLDKANKESTVAGIILGPRIGVRILGTDMLSSGDEDASKLPLLKPGFVGDAGYKHGGIVSVHASGPLDPVIFQRGEAEFAVVMPIRQ